MSLFQIVIWNLMILLLSIAEIKNTYLSLLGHKFLSTYSKARFNHFHFSVTNPSQWSVISETTKEDIIRKSCSRATQCKEMFKTAVNLYNLWICTITDGDKSTMFVKVNVHGMGIDCDPIGIPMWKRVDFEWFGFIYCIKKLNLQYFQ